MKKTIPCNLCLLMILISVGCVYSAKAQSIWKSKGPLYEDKNITIEIEYAIGDNPCSVGAAPSRYRYRITKLKGKSTFYVNWRFDYFDCNHELKTHQNSLSITKESRLGYFSPEDNSFPGLKLANNFNEVKRSASLPPVTGYEPVSTNSLEPKMINGKRTINIGETAVLNFTGGYLAANTKWNWYENNCNGKFVGSGSSLTIKPKRTTTYALRGEGEHPTACIMATITVINKSIPANGIEGRSQVCEGEKNVHLTVTGGQLADSAKWVWYQDNCGGKPVGEGNEIDFSPLITTVYYVRAEGPGGNTPCKSHQVIVSARSKAAEAINGADKTDYGESFTLSVRGGNLATDAQWVWYSGDAGNRLRLGTGSSFTVRSALSEQTYSVRAEGVCASTEFISKTVYMTTGQRPGTIQPVMARATTFFINGGIVAATSDQVKELKNYVFTIGGGKKIGWFLRAKLSSIVSKPDYQTEGMQILNYNQPGYYQYNGKAISKRSGYSAGIYLGGSNLAIYFGGGYGSRVLLYPIDQYTYGSPVPSSSAWVKQIDYSYQGAEVEGGLIVKTGVFNLMGGVSSIQGKYTDYNLGIGFNF